MLFNSVKFFIFFIFVFAVYSKLNHKHQNRFLLLASYVFYGAWDARFLALLWLSTVVDYFCGLRIDENTDSRERKKFLYISIFTNLMILGVFKYFNFFASNLYLLFKFFGLNLHGYFLKIILPVGISFYTFQTMSYTIDIYNNHIKPTKKFLDFALFVSFFPQLVAGPIERAKNLLPQILNKRTFDLDQFYEGCFLVLWGLFLKVYIADNLAIFSDQLFAYKGNVYDAFSILMGVYAFSFQIYCDFAGYSNIARGISKCMGFELMINFKVPYFASDPKEFWQRWHISLSSWLRDYLYIPLGGNKKGTVLTFRNLFITMFLGGLWHGAAWTFILWGVYQAALLIVYRLSENIKMPDAIKKSQLFLIFKILIFYHLVCIGWIFFRSETLMQSFYIFKGLIFSWHNISISGLQFFASHVLIYLVILLIYDFLRMKFDDEFFIFKSNVFVRAVFYYVVFISIFIFGVTGAKEFIYFQF